MPNYSAHIDIARQAATQLAHPVIDKNMGSYLLGSTSPDIRIITRQKREHYHFAPLDEKEISAGVKGLFLSHPHLADASCLSQATQAFMAGYISHLIADQAWIVYMYHPFFGNSDVFNNHGAGKVMDRALQLDLDRQAKENMRELEEIGPLLANADQGVELGFISGESLAQWREWLLEALNRGFTWERLRFLARRSLPEDPDTALGLAEEFLDSVSQGLACLYERVPAEKVELFRRRAIQEFVRVAGGYLS